MTLSLSRRFPANLYLGTSPYTIQQPWPTFRIQSKRFKRITRFKRQSSRLLGKSIQKRPLLESVMNNNSDNFTKLSIPAMHTLWARRLWFLHNALPLAVQLRPTKPNTLFKLELNATLPLKIWVGQKGIQFLKKVANTSLYLSLKNKQYNLWNFIQALDSYCPIYLTRLGFVPHPKEGKFWTKHGEIQKNGFTLESAWNPLIPADVIQNQKNWSQFWLNKVNKVYFDYPKSLYNFSNIYTLKNLI